ncbi:class C beta-lactamase-related serine hydrolase [Rhizobium ruizarguesonis]|uniref:serine hydrolase domain-containing protein n=1 Tax=Rhizobium ruizarguesonis TaxID=2081791 RepID=UPI0010325772|nr:serine hydrolase [Rhizobium ruizarguesonis]TBB57020.1 class C beta-lactamase-related serine hydrolase [Rhizobium ruizarguesonis]
MKTSRFTAFSAALFCALLLVSLEAGAAPSNENILPPSKAAALPPQTNIGDIEYACDNTGHVVCHLSDFMKRAKVCALIVVKADVTTFEKYDLANEFCAQEKAPPNGPAKLYGVASVTKSITSTVLGHVLATRGASSKGDFEKELSKTVGELTPQMRSGPLAGYADVPLDQLLRMRSGIWWSEYGWYGLFSGAALFAKLVRDDMQESVITFSRRFGFRSGSSLFNYSALDAAVAAAMAERLLRNGSLTHFFQTGLWTAIGAESKATWGVDNTGLAIGPCCFKASARDLARFGLFVLRGGRDAAGHVVIPQAWFNIATKPSARFPGIRPPFQNNGCRLDYGYFWWLRQNRNDFTAVGRDGQFLHVFPDSNTVIVQISDWHGWTNGDALECETFRAHDALASAIGQHGRQ